MPWSTNVAVQLLAGDTIINPSGMFVYSSAPAAGNLVASVTPAAGTDQFGNHYLEGMTSYGGTIATQMDQGAITLFTGSLAAGWTSRAQMFISAGGVIELITSAGVITSNNTLDNGAGNATFGGNVVVAGTLSVNGSTSTSQNGLTDGTINGSSATAGLANGQISNTSGPASAGTAHTHSAGTYAVTNGQHSHSSGTYAVTNGQHTHTL